MNGTEAGVALGVSPSTVHGYVKRGRLKAKKVQGPRGKPMYEIEKADLAKLKKELRTDEGFRRGKLSAKNRTKMVKRKTKRRVHVAAVEVEQVDDGRIEKKAMARLLVRLLNELLT